MSKHKAKNIYFTSDLHFGHEACIRYSNRPYKDVTEMNQKLIINWNSIVKQHDLVYVLGDFFMYLQKDQLREIINQLNGTKILVRGNHDMSQSEMLNIGFSVVVENAEITIANERVRLCHFPYKRPWYYTLFYNTMNKLIPRKYWKPRYFTRQLKDDGMWLLHGHVHSTRKHFVPGKKMIHVGVDAWDYKPVSIQKIGNMMAEIRESRYKE